MDESQAVQQAVETLTRYDMEILAWCAGFAAIAGLARSLDDRSYRDVVHLLSLGTISGFVGLGFCSGIAWILGGVNGVELLLFFVAPAAGLSGKVIEKHLRGLLIGVIDAVFARILGTPKDDNDGT